MKCIEQINLRRVLVSWSVGPIELMMIDLWNKCLIRWCLRLFMLVLYQDWLCTHHRNVKFKIELLFHPSHSSKNLTFPKHATVQFVVKLCVSINSEKISKNHYSRNVNFLRWKMGSHRISMEEQLMIEISNDINHLTVRDEYFNVIETIWNFEGCPNI